MNTINVQMKIKPFEWETSHGYTQISNSDTPGIATWMSATIEGQRVCEIKRTPETLTVTIYSLEDYNVIYKNSYQSHHTNFKMTDDDLKNDCENFFSNWVYTKYFKAV